MKQEQFLNSLVRPERDLDEIFYNFYEKVIATNKMIGLCYNLEEKRGSLIDTYTKLTQAEIKEFKEAVALQDKDNTVKEAVDILVTAGFKCFLQEGGNPVVRGLLPAASLRDEYINQLGAGVGEWDARRAICVAESLLAKLNIDLEKALDIVVASNLSKFSLASECNIEEEITRIESEGRYEDIYAEKVVDFDGNERVVLWARKEYGKLTKKYLKMSSYVEADMSKVWLS